MSYHFIVLTKPNTSDHVANVDVLEAVQMAKRQFPNAPYGVVWYVPVPLGTYHDFAGSIPLVPGSKIVDVIALRGLSGREREKLYALQVTHVRGARGRPLPKFVVAALSRSQELAQQFCPLTALGEPA